MTDRRFLPGPHPGGGPRAAARLPRPLAALLGLLAALASACGGGSPAPRLVVLYAPCSVSKGYLAPWNPGVGFTPHLAAFAAEGTVFERHENEAGQSGIDYAALFSGVQADRHGVFCHPKELSPRLFQVSEAFALAGYETFFWSGQKMGAWELGYGQGVPRRNAFTTEHTDLDRYTANDPRFDAILERLAADPDYKAFVQVNFTVSHNPYHSGVDPEEIRAFVRAFPDEVPSIGIEEAGRFLRLYDENRLPLQWDWEARAERLGLTPEERAGLAETLEFFYKLRIHQLDALFGRFVERVRAAGLLERSLIAFTADHGEILFRDNAIFQWTHGNQLAPEVIGVPWILHGPSAGVPAGRYAGVTRSIDVFPTLCGLAGIPLEPELPVDGRDVSAAVRGAEPPPAQLAFSHTTTIDARYDHLHAGTLLRALNPRDDPTLIWVRVRAGDLVVKHRYLGDDRWRWEAFDLASDPEERANLYDPEDPGQARLVGELKAYKRRLVEGYFANNASELSPAEADARLKDLGYIGADDAARDG